MKRIFSLLLLVCCLLLSGCAPGYKIISQEPSFTFSALRKAPCVIMATPDAISMYDFQKTFVQAYQTNEKFMGETVGDVTGRLRSSGLNVVADDTPGIYGKFLSDSGTYISSNKAEYIICIRGVSVDQKIVATGPTTRARLCAIVMEVVIMNIAAKKLVVSFNVSRSAQVSLWAYEAALRSAIDKTKGNLVLALLTEK